MNRRQCFVPARECKFVLDIVDSLSKLLVYVNPGKFGQFVLNFIVFQTKAEQKNTITLTLEGYVFYIYSKAFKETYPEVGKTPLQIERINAIWDAIGHPEKKISS